MIRAIRPNAMAQDDASLVVDWNVSPNVAYVVQLNPGSSACGVLLYDGNMTAIIASGAGLVGADQPVILYPYSGQTVGMVDVEVGWHLLLSTDGTESPRTIRIGPAVDLPDEIHPIYADDDLAVVRATAGVDDHAHYIDDVSVTCPLGLGVGLGAVAAVPIDGVALIGQVESITWTGTPYRASEQAVIRRHVAISPEPHVGPAPVVLPMVADDAAETDAITATSGNVLANDDDDLIVVAVNGITANVGVPVDGDSGGTFTIASDGAWIFDPGGDFVALEGSETANTSVTYHASDGAGEATATVTVTVTAATGSVLWTLADTTSAQWLDYGDAESLTWDGTGLAVFADKSGNSRHAVQSSATARPLDSAGLLSFNGSSHFLTHSVPQSLPSHIFWVIDTTSLQTGARCILNRIATAAPYPPGLYLGGQVNYRPELYWGATWTGAYSAAAARGLMLLECILTGTHAGWRINGGEAFLTAHGNAALSSWIATPTEYLPQSVAHKLGERAIINSAVDDALRWRIEGSFAHKWAALLGVTTLIDALPSVHPYKSSAPTV